MSIRNGDKARTNSQRHKRNAQRMKLRSLRAATNKSAAPAEKKSSKRGA